jgi:hypothetical protein
MKLKTLLLLPLRQTLLLQILLSNSPLLQFFFNFSFKTLLLLQFFFNSFSSNSPSNSPFEEEFKFFFFFFFFFKFFCKTVVSIC